jgi:hypothetical protein
MTGPRSILRPDEDGHYSREAFNHTASGAFGRRSGVGFSGPRAQHHYSREALRLDRESPRNASSGAFARRSRRRSGAGFSGPRAQHHYSREALRLDRESRRRPSALIGRIQRIRVRHASAAELAQLSACRRVAARHLDKLKHVPVTSRRGIK